MRGSGRLFKDMFLPPMDEEWVAARVSGKPDLHYQPYLFLAAFYGALLSMFIVSPSDQPPGESFGAFDLMWIIGALSSPVSGFVAMWMIRHRTGRQLYFALWLRLSSGIGMTTSLIAYESQRLLFSGASHPFEDALVVASVCFLLTLTFRDARLLLMTERLALRIRAGVAGACG